MPKAKPETLVPLAERMRPETFERLYGQEHLLGKGKILTQLIESRRLVSLIFWGPPGSGKTTLAMMLARHFDLPSTFFSAVLSGIKEVKEVMAQAESHKRLYGKPTIIFIDEIHRFNKAQQGAFLPYVERGDIILFGSTTENPSFEVIAPLLSRTRVLTLEPLDDEAVSRILDDALADPDRGIGRRGLSLDPAARRMLIDQSNGDARRSLNTLELAADLAGSGVIGPDHVREAQQKRMLLYDKDGEEHYNLISALHKSLRNSDVDAALYWLARMLYAGEDPLYIARRMVRFASEDVGLADPQALAVTLRAKEAYEFLGSPEGDLALAEAVVYLAAAPKSNRVYEAFGKVHSESGPTVDTIFGFTGRYFDDDTGLQWNLNRWYDPGVGRWLSEDPIGFDGQDPNLYRYVGNSPGDSVDPSGLDGKKQPLGAGAIKYDNRPTYRDYPYDRPAHLFLWDIVDLGYIELRSWLFGEDAAKAHRDRVQEKIAW
ncbi:MAG TPA: RHS repeat-associated core domain-containing protein, partial [Candidatus Aminicenantes bacterium]|nr:RHS repeat-associated core domain-containing protein [Candidatus Aminicenantes bacterium]